MAVEVKLSDGSRLVLNGRPGVIIEWIARHASEITSYRTLRVEIDCSPDAVKITHSPTEKIAVED